jgi:hypothetical protein
MRNKAIVFILTLFIMVPSFIAVQGTVYATTSGDFGYSIINNDTAAEITTYNGTGGAVSIPATIDGYSVVSIGSFAFYGKSTITEIVIPHGVTEIGYAAFYGCSALSSVTIPEGVTVIGNGAFNGCNSLSSVILPDSLVTIEGYAFYSSDLKSVIVPGNVTSIGVSVFQDCYNLTSATISNGLTNIGSGEFANCFNLTSVSIPISVTSIGDGAFYDCTSLKSMDISDNVTTIGNCVFQGCNGLSSLRLGSGLTTIGYAAFYGCSSLTSIIVPDNVTSMGYGAFYNCTALASVKIGSSVANIGALTFYDCTSLTNVEIPDSVSSIGYGTFYECASLTSVVVGSGVTNIGRSAFGNCSALVLITFRSNAPSLASDWIADYNVSLVVRYYNGASGFTTPLWEGIPTETVGSTLAAPQNIKAVPGPDSVTISWSALSGNGSQGIDYYIIYQDGVDVMHVASGTTYNVSGLANGGMYIFQVAAHDVAGPGLNSTSVSAGPAYKPMNVTITSPVQNSFINSEDVNVNWTIGDSTSVVAYFDISLDGVAKAKLSSNVMNYSLDGLIEGKHTVSIRAIDYQGNSATQEVTFTVDTTAPTIELKKPDGNEVSTRTAISVTFSEAMDKNATDIVLVGVPGSTIWNGSTATFVPASTLLGNTSFTVHLVGADMAGNAITETWTFTTADVGTISGTVTDADGSPVLNATVTLTTSSIQAGTDIVSTSVYPAERTVKTDDNGNYAFYDVASGNYKLTVTKDGYGTTISNVSLTSGGIASGGTTVSAVIYAQNSSHDINQGIEIVAIAAVAAVILLATFVVYKKRKKN